MPLQPPSPHPRPLLTPLPVFRSPLPRATPTPGDGDSTKQPDLDISAFADELLRSDPSAQAQLNRVADAAMKVAQLQAMKVRILSKYMAI
jgi:hypothetical protein